MILTEVLVALGVVVIIVVARRYSVSNPSLSVTGGDDAGRHCRACEGGAHHRCN
jgi:hypothetical protein